MKIKILLSILFAVVALSATAQTARQTVTMKDSTALVADTTAVLGPIKYDYVWAITIETWALDQSDATATIEVADDPAGPWFKYSDNAELSLPTTGKVSYADVSLAWNYIRVNIDAGTVSTGDYRAKMLRLRK